MNDADMEMAELAAMASTIAAYEHSHGCACQSVQSVSTLVGVQQCNNCLRTFRSFEAWTNFLAAVQAGTWDEAEDIQ